MATSKAGYILLTFRAYQEDNQWASECDELGVASCGDTLQDAFDALQEATQLYLETIEEEHQLERIFHERHIVIQPGAPPHAGKSVRLNARPYEVVSPRPFPITSRVA